MEKYNVDDIVYVLMNSDGRVVPLKIEEEIVRKTTQGITVSYIATSGTKSAKIDEIDGKVFKTSELCRDFLMEQAANNIRQIVDRAVTAASKRFSMQDDANTKYINGDLDGT